ncbi:zinc finger, PMZ-type containing protein [Tanacetum coccineum]
MCYPSFDPSTPWDQCKPVVGMKFKNPLQLKNMLANYGVANGYQLWFMQSDYSKLLVYCGRDVCEGKCAAFKGKKPKDKHDHAECTNSNIGDSSFKPNHAECSSKLATKKNGRTGQAMKESWSDKKEYEKKEITKKCSLSI